MKKITKFLNEVWVELKAVSWPSKDQIVRYTGLVIAISAFFGVFIGLVDYGLTQAVSLLIK